MLIHPATEDDLKYIVSLAKTETDAVGFIPRCRYEKIASGDSPNETLILCFENEDPVGFCYATHRNYGTKIQQILVQDDARRAARATALVEKVTRPGDVFLSLRCGADLEEANLFWLSLGFQPLRQRGGGRRRNRIIQEYGIIGGLLANEISSLYLPVGMD